MMICVLAYVLKGGRVKHVMYVMKQQQLKERDEQQRRKKEEEEAQAEQRRKEADAADADGDGHDDCPWSEGCDDEDKREL